MPRQELGSPLKLRAILDQLEIEILAPGDVERYHRERMNSVAKKKFEECLQDSDPYRAGQFHCPVWRETEIKDYKEPVPQFAWRKLVQIKKACPEATITIVHLEYDPDPFAPVAIKDRFLITEGESYWIDVWGEPKFEDQL